MLEAIVLGTTEEMSRETIVTLAHLARERVKEAEQVMGHWLEGKRWRQGA